MRLWHHLMSMRPPHACVTLQIATCLTFSALALFIAFFSLPSAPFLGAMAALVLRPALLSSHTQAPADSRTRRLTSGCQRQCLCSQAVLRCQAAGRPSGRGRLCSFGLVWVHSRYSLANASHCPANALWRHKVWLRGFRSSFDAALQDRSAVPAKLCMSAARQHMLTDMRTFAAGKVHTRLADSEKCFEVRHLAGRSAKPSCVRPHLGIICLISLFHPVGRCRVHTSRCPLLTARVPITPKQGSSA